MNKMIGIIGLVIVVMLVAAGFTGFLPMSLLGDGEYHTGFSWSDINNGETKHLDGGNNIGDLGAWWGNVVDPYTELIRTPMNNNPIVTEMTNELGGDSVTVSMYGTVSYAGPVGPYWEAKYGWYEVYIKKDVNGPWLSILNTKDNSVDSEIVTLVSGDTYKQQYATQHGWGYASYLIPIVGMFNTNIHKSMGPVEFKLKGRHVGIMKVEQHTEFWGAPGHTAEDVVSRDYTFLISGIGTVDIVNDAGRYLEGDTIQFEVNTGYSGSTQGGEWVTDGWLLEIKDSSGSTRKSWDIADDQMDGRKDVNGNDLKYVIPSDCWNPDGSNKWTVVLTNRLFMQDYKTYFTISEEEAAKAPSMKDITYDQDKYNLGDDVKITFTGEPNYDGNGRVDGFFVQIRYGTSGSNFYPGYEGTYIQTSSGSVSKTITIRPAKGDISMVVEAWAFDDIEYEGGRMSEKMTSSFWVEDEEREPVTNLGLILTIILIIAMFVVVGFLLSMYVHPMVGYIIIILGFIIALIYFLMSTGSFDVITDIIPWWLGGSG